METTTREVIDEITSELLTHKSILAEDYKEMCQKPRSFSASEKARVAEAHARVCETLSRIVLAWRNLKMEERN